MEKKVPSFLRMCASLCYYSGNRWLRNIKALTPLFTDVRDPRLLEGTSKKLRSLWKFDWKCVCMYYLSNKGPTKNIILLLGVPLYKSFLDEALSSWRSHRTKLLTRWVTSSKPQQDRGSPSEHLNSCSSLFCNGCTLLVYKSRMCMRWKILKGAP